MTVMPPPGLGVGFGKKLPSPENKEVPAIAWLGRRWARASQCRLASRTPRDQTTIAEAWELLGTLMVTSPTVVGTQARAVVCLGRQNANLHMRRRISEK